MKRLRQLARVAYIQIVFARNGVDALLLSPTFLAPLRFLLYFNPWHWFKARTLSPAAGLRKSFEELGPIFVKFGQALSTRPDILTPELAQELSKLQDSVPPFSKDIALQLIEKAYGCSAFEIFDDFDVTPLASASMAQVHAARLKTGEEVVIKILRPGMEKVIQQDLAILYTLADLVQRYWPVARPFKPREIVQEFSQNLMHELDLRREAANAALLRRNFLHSSLLYVPDIYWDYAKKNMMVMERIYGIPITDIGALNAHHINIKKLAERGVEIFFTQVFRDCFFHADMHPGNIFVAYHTPDSPQYICIDFGIMGTLTESDKRYLAENLYAFFTRNYRRVAELHVESGWVLRNTRVDEFESAIRTVCEPIFQKPLQQISLAEVVLQFFQVARQFEVQVQPQLVLLQKTLLAIEGLGRQLYPGLDLWVTAKPFLEKWIKEQIGPRALLRQFRENIPFFTEELPHLPRLLYDVLTLTKNSYVKALDTQRVADKPEVSRFFKGMGFGIVLGIGLMGFVYLLMK